MKEAAFNRIGWDAWELQSAENYQFLAESQVAFHPVSTKSERQTVNADTQLRPSNDKPYRAVLLDRDGVINRPVNRAGQPYHQAVWRSLKFYRGVPEACRILKKLGFLLEVTTNQPDVGRGVMAREVVERIHGWLLQELPINRAMICFHTGVAYGDPCDCRKPLTGMLSQVAAELKINLAKSFMVGDRRRDLDCGFNAGCKTVFIELGLRSAVEANYTLSCARSPRRGAAIDRIEQKI